MLRKFLLPAAALIALGGCVTGYGYRAGNGGDYYYGQPQVEYRHVGPYVGAGVYYGGYYSGMRPIAYYDRFGRLVYGYPYATGYYGAPYYGYPYYRAPYYGYPHAKPPRVPHPPRPGDNHAPPDPGHDPGRHDRKPPWRDFGRLQPRQDLPGDPAAPSRTRSLLEDSADAAAPRPSLRTVPAGRIESSRRQVMRDPAQAEQFARPAMPNEVREIE